VLLNQAAEVEQRRIHIRPVPFRLESIGLEILIVTRRDVFLYREIQSKYQFPPR
jgi:hypothetical protein